MNAPIRSAANVSALPSLDYHPIANAPIDRPIIIKRGDTIARARWRRNRQGTGGAWIYDVRGNDEDIEVVDFAPTHWRDFQETQR